MVEESEKKRNEILVFLFHFLLFDNCVQRSVGVIDMGRCLLLQNRILSLSIIFSVIFFYLKVLALVHSRSCSHSPFPLFGE